MDEMAQVLAATAEEFANAEVIDRWMPPDGTYTVLLRTFKEGVAGETSKFAWWRLEGTILDDANPEVSGKDFTVGYYTSKAYGFVKGAASILAGRKVTSNTEIAPVLKAAAEAGTVIIVEVVTSKSRKTNVEYTNANILRVVPNVPQTAGGTAAGPTDSAPVEGATA